MTLPVSKNGVDGGYKEHDEKGVAHGQDGRGKGIDNAAERLQPPCKSELLDHSLIPCLEN